MSGEDLRVRAEPKLVEYAFSNEHFERLVGLWRGEIDRADKTKGKVLPLGPWYRRMLVKVALGFSYRDHIGFVRAVAESAPNANLNIDTMLKAFERKVGGIDWAEHLVRYAWQQIFGGLPIQRRDLEPMHLSEFLEGAWFIGPNAPFIFMRRLLGMPRMKHWTDDGFGIRGAFDDRSDARHEAYQRVQRFLAAPPTDGRPCLVIHSAVYQRGLSALAGKLLAEDTEEARFKGLPRCLLYASPHAPPHKGVDLPFIVNQILAFYAAYQIEEAPAVPDVDVRRDIEFVRTLMTRYPAVFVIDGVQDFGGDIPDLRAAMLDDPIRQLLGHLFYPDLCRADALADSEIFRRNRFILLADGPCKWLEPMADAVVALPAPSVPTARRYIRDDGAYRNGASLKTYFDQAGAERGGEEPYLQCADVLLTLDPSIRSLPPLDELAVALVRTLVAFRQEWFVPLLLLILTPGGMRPQTLFRVLNAWRQSSPTGSQNYLNADGFDPAGLTEFRSAFHAMIIVADDHTLRSAIVREVATTSDGIGSTQETLIFASARSGELLLEVMLQMVEPQDLAALHVGLAEESMRQHTKLMRLTERDDHHSVRINRRLLQAIYHGMMALDFSDEAGAGAPTTIHRPAITKLERFSRIYAMFYRLLLEAPPHWEMSRVMAAGRIKRDLLLTMLATQQPIKERIKRIEISFDPPHWLLREVSSNSGIAAIAIDLYTALCKTTLQLNELDEADHALAGAEVILAATNPRYVKCDSADDLLNIGIDAAIVRDNLAQALQEVRRGLGSRRCQSAYLSTARGALRAASSTDPFPLRQIVASFSRAQAGRTISLVQRWAEILATSVDPPPNAKSGLGSHRRTRRLEDAYALFAFADALRWAAFIDDPFTRAFVPSGHAARVQIRVLMLRAKRQGISSEERAGLHELARHRVDTLTRSLVRYPAERASMMILEGILDRAEDRTDAGMIAALGSLIAADRQMLWASDRPRLRMRLLFERAKLLSRLANSKNANADTFAMWARLDAKRLKLLAGRSGSKLWQRLAASLRIPKRTVRTFGDLDPEVPISVRMNARRRKLKADMEKKLTT